MQVTLKQIEAVYWVHVLGGFAAAARRLNTTQSAISKRIGELEHQFGQDMFDRHAPPGTLTLKGREIIEDLSAMLRLRERIELTLGETTTYTGHLRFGVTEMVALTWLPALLAAIKQVYPQIVIEPRIDVVSRMLPQLMKHSLDLVLGPLPPAQVSCTVVELGGLEYAWMASPHALRHGNTLQSLLELPLLTYAEDSLLRDRIRAAAGQIGREGSKPITCNSIVALAELARAGLGATYIPRHYFQNYLDTGDLVIIDAGPERHLQYAAFYFDNPVCRTIADLSRAHCDFTRTFSL